MQAAPPELDRFDVVSASARSRIHDVYREMRAVGPLHRFTDPYTGTPSWLVLSHADALRVLRDNDVFIRDQTRLMDAAARARREQLPAALKLILSDMVHQDPPEHTRLRGLVGKAFTPARVASLRPRVRAIAEELLDEVAGRATFDLIESFAFPLPIRVILELLGIDARAEAQFAGWSSDILGDDFSRTLAALEAYRDFAEPLIDAREREPTDDLLSHLVRARTESGARLSRSEIHSMLILLLIAGHETTVNLIANGTVALLERPRARERLAADVSLMPRAVEELLRFDGPLDFASVRYAFTETRLSGVPIARGEQVFVSLLAANRDPSVFERPESLELTRRGAKAIAFGAGVHACIGAALARMETAEALTVLHARRPRLQLAVPRDSLTRRKSRIINAFTALPVRDA